MKTILLSTPRSHALSDGIYFVDYFGVFTIVGKSTELYLLDPNHNRFDCISLVVHKDIGIAEVLYQKTVRTTARILFFEDGTHAEEYQYYTMLGDKAYYDEEANRTYVALYRKYTMRGARTGLNLYCLETKAFTITDEHAEWPTYDVVSIIHDVVVMRSNINTDELRFCTVKDIQHYLLTGNDYVFREVRNIQDFQYEATNLRGVVFDAEDMEDLITDAMKSFYVPKNVSTNKCLTPNFSIPVNEYGDFNAKQLIILAYGRSLQQKKANSYNLTKAGISVQELHAKLKPGDGVVVLEQKKIYCFTYTGDKKVLELYSTLNHSENVNWDKPYNYCSYGDFYVYANDAIAFVKRANSMLRSVSVIPQGKSLSATTLKELDPMYLPLANGDRSKETLITLYENTTKILNNKYYLTTNKRVNLYLNSNFDVDTRFYRNEIHPVCYNRFNRPKIQVVEKDCLDVVRDLQAVVDNPSSVAVLNMASRKRPGGRVYMGGLTQEAYLFRCSDYGNSLYQYDRELALKYGVQPSVFQYPLDPEFGGVYSPGVTVFRASDADGYALLDNPHKVNVIAVPGIARPESIHSEAISEYVRVFKNKIRTILRIAIDNLQKNLVLGALGCGGLNNIPATIALIFHDVLNEDEFLHAFEHVYFSILSDDVETIEAFKKQFETSPVHTPSVEEFAEEEVRIKRNEIVNLKADLYKTYTNSLQSLISTIDKQQSFDEYIHGDITFVKIVLALNHHLKGKMKLNLDYLFPLMWGKESVRMRDDLEEYFEFHAEDGVSFSYHVDQLLDEGYNEDIIALALLRHNTK